MDITPDSRSNFRVGYPRLLSLPLQSDPGQWVHRGLGIHHRPIMTILRDCEVEIDSFGLMDRSHPGSDPSERETVICLSDATIPGQYDAWQAAVKEIAAYLHKHALDANIEIIDRFANCTIMTDIITHNDDEVLRLWSEKREDVVRRLSGLQWTAIDIVRWGIREDDLKPTILITASDADEEAWDSVRDDLINLFNNIVGVEIRYGPNAIHCGTPDEELSDFSDEDQDECLYKNELAQERAVRQRHNADRTCPITIEAFQKSIEMGTSISTIGGNSGTLGGFFQIELPNHGLSQGLEPTERKIWVGITNHHVVSKAKDGTVNGDLLAEPVIVVSPSQKDHENFISLCRIRIHELNFVLRNPGSKFRALTDERRRRHREKCRQTRTTKRMERDSAMQFSPVAGSLLASSGRRGRENPRYSTTQNLAWSSDHQRDCTDPFPWDADWALFTINPEKNPQNYTSRSMDENITNKVSGDEPCEWQSISERLVYPVAKLGRTSGWTTGNINAAASILRQKKLSQTQKETSVLFGFTDSVDELDKPVLVHSILPNTVDSKAFVEPGDSGSLVLLNEGRLTGASTVVGLAIGANKTTKVSYMNPIDLIIQDIQDTTGGRVIYPEGKGTARDYPKISVNHFVE